MTLTRLIHPFRILLTAATSTALLLTGCTGFPKGSHPIAQLDVQRYLGTWYEIARFDHRFERGLECVTAQYSLRDDGLLKVTNRGRKADSGEWKEAQGKAALLTTPPSGRLKVSFFGPFYSGYNILELDSDYRYALVAGPNHDYLWILSRTPTLADADYAALVASAQAQGFDTSALMRIPQNSASCTVL